MNVWSKDLSIKGPPPGAASASVQVGLIWLSLCILNLSVLDWNVPDVGELGCVCHILLISNEFKTLGVSEDVWPAIEEDHNLYLFLEHGHV